MESSKKTIVIVLVLVAITAGLVYVDYSSGQKGGSPGFFSSAIRGIITPTTITPELVSKAAFDPQTLLEQASSNDFFAPYLKLPENTTATVYTLGGDITISEVQSENAFEIVALLTKMTSTTGTYHLNVINTGTFYLNQIGTKTHNYLAIVINNVLYGFQYPVSRHPDILRLIDSIQNNQ